jgi:dynein heavy chain
MMKDVNKFMLRLKDFNMKELDDKLVKALGILVEDPGFTYEIMMGKSSAAGNLCLFVISVYKFNRIYVKVKPLMDSLAAAQATKAEAEGKLAVAMQIVKEVNEKLDELQVSLP